VVATHAVFVTGALHKMADAGVQQLTITDSIPLLASLDSGLVPTTVTIAPLITSAIHRVLDGGSLRELA
jgi:phosphoribosylpyrophosphate synthetase